MSADRVPPLPPGARALGGNRCSFSVWAPRAARIDLLLHPTAPRGQRAIPLEPRGNGWFHANAEDVAAGDLYLFRLDGRDTLPDPASRSQPGGVHGPSAVVPETHDWNDRAGRGRPLDEYVLYEIHVGTFTREGTLDAVVPRLAALRDLGITALELMPVAEFAGPRNWGYDGVFPFAVHHVYGGAQALKRLVDACHALDLAVVLDVVYNHLGPEGNYLDRFGPYYTDRYATPWGRALDFDGAHSAEVRGFFIHNALQWTGEFHIDALRLDAVHAILDHSDPPFLRELANRVHTTARDQGRAAFLIAESDADDPATIRPAERGGLGMDAQWLDDFHHSLHAILTGESAGYYMDFGRVSQLATSYDSGFVYTGQYSAFRGHGHGAPVTDARPSGFVVFAQNHDQIGNRLAGDRLAATLDCESLKLAAAAVILSPYLPLLFMGEEYGETNPFPYFVSHEDAALVEAVRDGRAAEFAAFGWIERPPDPQDETTFRASILDWNRRYQGHGAMLLRFHRHLLRLRRRFPALRTFDRIECSADEEARTLAIMRTGARAPLFTVLNMGDAAATVALPPARDGWQRLFDSADTMWDGPGSAVPARTGAIEQARVQARSALLLQMAADPT